MAKNNKYQVQKSKPKYEERKPDKKQITFSFALLLLNKRFDYKNKKTLNHEFYTSMIDMLQCNSKKTSEEIVNDITNNSHNHPVKSKNSRKQRDFDRLYAIDELPPDFSGVPKYQLGFDWSNDSEKKESRLHGFIKNDVFYVRLIDPKHKVYPQK